MSEACLIIKASIDMHIITIPITPCTYQHPVVHIITKAEYCGASYICSSIHLTCMQYKVNKTKGESQ